MFGDNPETRTRILAAAGAVAVVVFLLLLVATDVRILPALIWALVLAFLAGSGLALWLGEGTGREASEPRTASKPDAGPERSDRAETQPAPAEAADAAARTAGASPKSQSFQAEPPEPKAETSQEPAAADEKAPQDSAEEATRPKQLDGPREGKADDLKEIKGIGPKLEEQCNSLGIYHFDQIADWSDAEVAWMDESLEGFRGRVTRDKWVEQARELAKETDT